MIFKKSLLLHLLFIWQVQANGQPGTEKINDTTDFLNNQFAGLVAEVKEYKDGQLYSINRYSNLIFSVKACTTYASVRMEQKFVNKKPVSYTLNYIIPLAAINTIATKLNTDVNLESDGIPIVFTTKKGNYSIHYTMTEDHTGRIEVDNDYAECKLWCRKVDGKKVIDLLNELKKRCVEQ